MIYKNEFVKIRTTCYVHERTKTGLKTSDNDKTFISIYYCIVCKIVCKNRVII